MTWWRWLVFGSAVLLAGACTSDAPASESTTSDPTTIDRSNATVTYIVDGDTIDALIDGPGGAVEERIRLIGIDTPETKRPNTPIECFGPEATAAIEELVPVGTSIRIERDLVARDDFGRLLGYVYRSEDDVFVNLELVRQGFATPLSIEPNVTFRDEIVDAARAAEANDLGLWAACPG